MSSPLTPQGIHTPEEIHKFESEAQRAFSAMTKAVTTPKNLFTGEGSPTLCVLMHTKQVVSPSREWQRKIFFSFKLPFPPFMISYYELFIQKKESKNVLKRGGDGDKN